MLSEGVVAAPMDIDLAMITGAGFQFWNGGLCPLLDREGSPSGCSGSACCPPGSRASRPEPPRDRRPAHRTEPRWGDGDTIISQVIYARPVTVTSTSDTYLTRIGNLIRDARKHRGWTQAQLADVPSTSQSAVNRIEQGHQNLTLEMLARIGEALDSEIVSWAPGRPTSGSPADRLGLHRRQVVQERRRRPAVRSAAQQGAARRCARSPASRRSTGSSRCSTASASHHWLNAENDLEIVPPAPLDLGSIERGRPPHPLDHHVPRPADAPRGPLRAALRRRLRPRHPHRRAAHGGAAAVRPRREGHRGRVPRDRRDRAITPLASRSC